MLPPKMGDGHEGSSAGAVHAFFSSVLVSATAADRIGRGAAGRTGMRTAWPAKPLRWAVHVRWAICIPLSMVVAIGLTGGRDRRWQKSARCCTTEGTRDKALDLRSPCTLSPLKLQHEPSLQKFFRG